MPLFSKPQSYLGIDFDNNSVKIVELKNEKGRPRLVTYGYADIDMEKSSDTKEKDNIQETAKMIKAVCKAAKTTTNKVVTSLPAYSVFTSILNLPYLQQKDLASAVRWEAKKVVPMPIDEMILDYKVLEEFEANQNEENNQPEDEEKKEFQKISTGVKHKFVKVLLTAAPKDLVKRYMEIFKSSGLNLLSLDTESFALIRSLIGFDKSAIMVVDIGSVVTNISIVSNGVPVLNRSIDVGGLTMTKAVANSLNISLSRAEQFKYDIGVTQRIAGQGNIPQTIESSLVPIVDELKYSLNLYHDQGQKQIEKVVLTGGSSLLLGLPEYLSNILSLRVFLGDPWARVIYPEELKPVLDSLGARYSVALGLAMRDIE